MEIIGKVEAVSPREVMVEGVPKKTFGIKIGNTWWNGFGVTDAKKDDMVKFEGVEKGTFHNVKGTVEVISSETEPAQAKVKDSFPPADEYYKQAEGLNVRLEAFKKATDCFLKQWEIENTYKDSEGNLTGQTYTKEGISEGVKTLTDLFVKIILEYE